MDTLLPSFEEAAAAKLRGCCSVLQLDGALADASRSSLAREPGVPRSAPSAAQIALQHLKKTEELLERERRAEESGGAAEEPGDPAKADCSLSLAPRPHTVYELFYVPDTKPLALRSRMTQTERRLAALENLVGISHVRRNCGLPPPLLASLQVACFCLFQTLCFPCRRRCFRNPT